MSGGTKQGRREAAIAALLSCATIREAARKLGVGEATLRRWLVEPEFQAAYREARRHVVEAAIGRLQQVAAEAVATLQRNLACGTPAVEVSAARVVLDQAVKAIELMDLSERVHALEGSLQDTQPPRTPWGEPRERTMRSLKSRVERLERSEQVSPAPKQYSHYQLLHVCDLVDAGETEARAWELVGPPELPIESGKPTPVDLILATQQDHGA